MDRGRRFADGREVAILKPNCPMNNDPPIGTRALPDTACWEDCLQIMLV
ncbi:hypothetical protein [Neobacillus sp. YIM B06451]|nr:hypothetical protein [Neobacillus sp. YIM B06451]